MPVSVRPARHDELGNPSFRPPTSDYKLARYWTTMATRDAWKKLHPAETR